MNLFRKYFKTLFFLLLILPIIAMGQDDPKPTKKQKKAEQKKEQRAQDAKKAEIKGRKQHMNIQDKKTRKRMKKNKKQGSAYVSRRPGFFQRLSKGFR